MDHFKQFHNIKNVSHLFSNFDNNLNNTSSWIVISFNQVVSSVVLEILLTQTFLEQYFQTTQYPIIIFYTKRKFCSQFHTNKLTSKQGSVTFEQHLRWS